MADEPELDGLEIPPPTPEEATEGADSLAEEIAISSGLNLKSHRTKQAIDRILREGAVHTHMHRIVIWGLYILALSAGAMFLAVVYHLLSPCPFLNPEQLADIKQLLFSGAVGAGASGLAKKYLGIGNGDKDAG